MTESDRSLSDPTTTPSGIHNMSGVSDVTTMFTDIETTSPAWCYQGTYNGDSHEIGKFYVGKS